jgi:hypothetical protein
MGFIRPGWLKRSVWVAAVVSSAVLSGCASFYVDNGLKSAESAQVVVPVNPKPVQLFFSFKTKGQPNGQATQYLQGKVTDLIKQSGLFSELKDAAAPGVGTLQITINNELLTQDAAAKGFVTGLTLGLAGSTVGDGYRCELTYRASDNAPELQAQVNHAIYTSIGNSSGPDAAATKMANGDEAINTMVRQAIKALLIKLSTNPQFSSAK